MTSPRYAARSQPWSSPSLSLDTSLGVLSLKPNTILISQLIERVRTRWPDRRPYGKSNLDVIPHLTITDGASEAIAAQAQADVAAQLPLKAVVSAVTLVVFDGYGWFVKNEFMLRPARATQEPPLRPTHH